MDDHENLLDIADELNTLCNVHNAHLSAAKLRDTVGNKEKTDWKQINNSTSDTKSSLDTMDKLNILNGIHKAHVSIAKFRNAIGATDKENNIGFRCSECAKCLTCKRTSRRTAISLHEVREQQFIEERVRIVTNLRKVVVNYPFLMDPVKSLLAKHNRSNNYNKALRGYIQVNIGRAFWSKRG